MQTTKSERAGLREYCRQCTDAQLQNVYRDEKARAKRCSDPNSVVGHTARIFAEEARVVLAERGLLNE